MSRKFSWHASVSGAILLAGGLLAAETPSPDLWLPRQGGTSSGGGFTLSGDLLAPVVLTNEVQRLAFEPLYWTISVPPVLKIEPALGSVVISWPASLAHWELEVSTNAASRTTAWSTIMPLRQTNHSQVSVTVPISTSAQLYRLRQPERL